MLFLSLQLCSEKRGSQVLAQNSLLCYGMVNALYLCIQILRICPIKEVNNMVPTSPCYCGGESNKVPLCPAWRQCNRRIQCPPPRTQGSCSGWLSSGHVDAGNVLGHGAASGTYPFKQPLKYMQGIWGQPIQGVTTRDKL